MPQPDERTDRGAEPRLVMGDEPENPGEEVSGRVGCEHNPEKPASRWATRPGRRVDVDVVDDGEIDSGELVEVELIEEHEHLVVREPDAGHKFRIGWVARDEFRSKATRQQIRDGVHEPTFSTEQNERVRRDRSGPRPQGRLELANGDLVERFAG